MLAAVKGYYDGKQIVMEENIDLTKGQEVIVTILDMKRKEKKKVDIKQYVGRGEKMFHTDAQEYVRELRVDDRM